MSPHRQLSQSSHRHPTTDQDIFIGFASSLSPADGDDSKPRDLEYTVVLHDGTGIIETETLHFDFAVYEDEDKAEKEVKRFANETLALLRKIQTNKHMNVGWKRVEILMSDPFGSSG